MPMEDPEFLLFFSWSTNFDKITQKFYQIIIVVSTQVYLQGIQGRYYNAG